MSVGVSIRLKMPLPPMSYPITTLKGIHSLMPSGVSRCTGPKWATRKGSMGSGTHHRVVRYSPNTDYRHQYPTCPRQFMECHQMKSSSQKVKRKQRQSLSYYHCQLSELEVARCGAILMAPEISIRGSSNFLNLAELQKLRLCPTEMS